MDEDLMLVVLKAVMFVVICLGAGMLLAHWMLWG